jgi:DNA-3-methyladenine glycosylase I
VHGEQALLERLSLEAFQSGLSWLTILRKRAAFRTAFAGFDPDVVAGFGPDEVQTLLAEPAIVRNRRKIEATIANARAALALREHGGLDALVWSARPQRHRRPQRLSQAAAHTEESARLARALKQAGFAHLGPTTSASGPTTTPAGASGGHRDPRRSGGAHPALRRRGPAGLDGAAGPHRGHPGVDRADPAGSRRLLR